MSTFTPPALHGIIGYPLGHSMSPLMHNTAFKALNLPGVYLSWPIEPERLPAFVDAARLLNIRGCSITIPHKIDIIPLLDKTSENVKEMGACNTIYRDGEKICGENTDVIGFTAPLRRRSLSPETRVLVLGAGGVSGGHCGTAEARPRQYYAHQPPERARGSPLQRIRFAVRSVGRARRRPR